MNEKLTKLTEAFRIAYHNKYHRRPVVADSVVHRLFTDDEYMEIYNSTIRQVGDGFSNYGAARHRRLKAMINRTICGKVLADVAFSRRSLENASVIGAGQYIIINAGYDCFPHRQPDWAKSLEIFEVNPLDIAMDKRARLTRAGIDTPFNVNYVYRDVHRDGWEKLVTCHPRFVENKISFVNLTGLDMDRECLEKTMKILGDVLAAGSSVVFSCMQADFLPFDEDECGQLEMLMSRCGFLIYEQLEKEDVEEQFFRMFNFINYKFQLKAPAGVYYCLAVKKEHK